MNLAIASLNPAIERLLVVHGNSLGKVHTLIRDDTLAGGKGVNVARVFAQLSTPEFAPSGVSGSGPYVPRLFGPLGGATGGLLRALLQEEGIDGDWIDILASTRTNEVIVDDEDPEAATVYNAVGPIVDKIELAQIRAVALSTLANSSALVCTGSVPPGIPQGIYRELIFTASTLGIPSLLDAHGEVLRIAAEATPTIIKVNRDELADLAGEVGAIKQMNAWLAAGTSAVIITDGSEPTVAVTPDGWFETTPPRIKTLSAVGSGDAFTAGLLWSFLNRTPNWQAHLRIATACGASNAADMRARLSRIVRPAEIENSVSIRRIEQNI